MDVISISQVAEKWGISQRRIRKLCSQGRIDGAYKVGAYWVIPVGTEKPRDERLRTGRHTKK